VGGGGGESYRGERRWPPWPPELGGNHRGWPPELGGNHRGWPPELGGNYYQGLVGSARGGGAEGRQGDPATGTHSPAPPNLGGLGGPVAGPPP
jgi:hypothetical protein